MKVLVAEDEDTLRENLRDFLQRRGWEARVARTGRAAVAACADFRPQVVLVDYQLPDMTGFQLIGTLRQQFPCGCILMTAHPDNIVSDRAHTHGICHILYKPFSLVEMESALIAEASQPPA